MTNGQSATRSDTEARLRWTSLSFAEVFDDVTDGGRKLQQRLYLPTGPYPVVDQGEGLIGGYTDREDLVHLGHPPFIVFGDHTRCVKFVDFQFVQGADGIRVLKPKPGVDPRFAYLLLRAAELPDMGYSRHMKFLRRATFPIPEPDEQTRIVALIEDVLGFAISARRDLSRSRVLAGRFTRALLHAAFNGDVVPFEKRQKTIGELAVRVTKGESPRWQGFDYTSEGILFVRSQNVGFGCMLLKDQVFLPATFNEGRTKSVLQENDVLLNIVGASIGRTVVVPRAVAGANCNQAVSIIRLGEDYVDSRFLNLWLLSDVAQQQIVAGSVDVARANLSLEDIRRLSIPWPDRMIREMLVARIEEVLDFASKVVREIDRIDSLMNRLERRLVSKALCGDLFAAK